MCENITQHSGSLSAIFKSQSNDMHCVDALFKWKWTDAFIRSEYASRSYWSLKLRKQYQCNHCHFHMPVNANAIFENSNLTQTIWFLSIHLKTQSSAGISALSLKLKIGVFIIAHGVFTKKYACY